MDDKFYQNLGFKFFCPQRQVSMSTHQPFSTLPKGATMSQSASGEVQICPHKGTT
jgi:hypothetical protein